MIILIVMGLCLPIYYFLNLYKVASILLGSTIHIFMALGFYLGGGIKSPGLFWFSIIPMMQGGMNGLKGHFYSTALVFSTVGWFIYLEQTGVEVPNYVDQHSDFRMEYARNVLIFLTVYITSHAFNSRAYAKSMDTIRLKGSQVENLLRILIHDVANPLTIISLRLRRLLKKNPNDEDFLEMDQALKDIEEQIGNVRKLRSLSDGKLKISMKQVDLPECVEYCAQGFKDRLQQKNIGIKVDNFLNNTFVWADKVVLKNQILNNLLSNAIKFSYPGSVIRIEFMNSSTNTILKIIDTGMGMSQKTMDSLFDMYIATSRTGTQGEAGTGYGMPLVKAFMDQFGGSIKVESVEDINDVESHGTTITLSFRSGNGDRVLVDG